MSGRPWYKRCGADFIEGTMGGGRTTLGNLTVACLPCNRSKGAKTVQEWLS